MRNLAQYPVTKDEIIHALQKVRDAELLAQTTNMSTGSMQLAALQYAIKTIENLSEDQIARM